MCHNLIVFIVLSIESYNTKKIGIKLRIKRDFIKVVPKVDNSCR